jgi:hypothetical protein
LLLVIFTSAFSRPAKSEHRFSSFFSACPITSILLREKDARPAIIYAASSRADWQGFARVCLNNKMILMSDFAATSPRKKSRRSSCNIFSTVAAPPRSFAAANGFDLSATNAEIVLQAREPYSLFDALMQSVQHRSAKLSFAGELEKRAEKNPSQSKRTLGSNCGLVCKS